MRSPDRDYSRYEHAAAVVTVLTGAIGLTACSAVKAVLAPDQVFPSYGPTAPPTPERPSVEVVPDFSDYRRDGKCDGGQPAPCFLPLRKKPEGGPINQETLVNLLDGTDQFRWPLEQSAGSAGDKVKVVCQVKGKNIVQYRDGGKSDVWDVVHVPTSGMSSAAIYEAQHANGTQTYGIERDENGVVTGVFAFAPASMLQHPDIHRLPPCHNDPNNLAGSPNPQNLPPAS